MNRPWVLAAVCLLAAACAAPAPPGSAAADAGKDVAVADAPAVDAADAGIEAGDAGPVDVAPPDEAVTLTDAAGPADGAADDAEDATGSPDTAVDASAPTADAAGQDGDAAQDASPDADPTDADPTDADLPPADTGPPPADTGLPPADTGPPPADTSTPVPDGPLGSCAPGVPGYDSCWIQAFAQCLLPGPTCVTVLTLLPDGSDGVTTTWSNGSVLSCVSEVSGSSGKIVCQGKGPDGKQCLASSMSYADNMPGPGNVTGPNGAHSTVYDATGAMIISCGDGSIETWSNMSAICDPLQPGACQMGPGGG